MAEVIQPLPDIILGDELRSLECKDSQIVPGVPKLYLGTGGYSRVFEATFISQDPSTPGIPIAAKELLLTKTNRGKVEKRFKRELVLLSKCKSEFLVPLIGYVLDRNEAKYIIVMGLMEIDLDDHIQKAKKNPQLKVSLEQRMKNILRIAKGMKFLHSCSVAHRDLTASNIFLNKDGLPFIADFGMARDDELATKQTNYKKRYVPPEHFQRVRTSFPADVYQFSLLLWEIYNYHRVFEDLDERFENPLGVMDEVRTKKIRPPLDVIPKDLHDILSRGWAVDPGVRPKADEVVRTLELYAETIGLN